VQVRLGIGFLFLPNLYYFFIPHQMDQISNTPASPLPGRITSVDLFRGITMFLLVGEGARFYGNFEAVEGNRAAEFIAMTFSHHEWHGLHFWDLIQPFFMFIVGVAIPFAVANRIRKGDSDEKIFRHALKRSFLLLFFGWALYCIDPGRIVFRFQNVLAQLSVTYLVAFLIMKRSLTFQLIFSLVVLLITDLAYRFFPVEGFNHPWVPYENLGAWVNNKIEGVDKADIWASLNAIPTIAHTVWGVICGRILMSDRPANKKIQTMLIGGVAALVVGYALDWLNITPIIKKIATSSFVFASGGWAILVLCLLYWLLDVKKEFIGASKFFIIVGMNSIFIYLFMHLGGAGVLTEMFTPFTKGLFSWSGTFMVGLITSIAVWGSLWYICYWLYKNRLFISI
jgi:predicted acyltransferase